MRTRLLLLATACAAAPLAAQANTEAERTAVDPLLKSTARSTAPGVVVEFATKEQTARAQIGGGMGSLNQWGLTVSGPLNRSGNTTLATGEGLASGTAAEFLVRHATSPARRDVTAEDIRRVCMKYLNKPGCSRRDLPATGQRELDNLVFQAAWVLGASVKAGRKTFAFTDPATFVDGSEAHTGWSASASAGRIQAGALSALLYYVGASYRHENAYVGGSERNVCTPIGTSTSTVCRDIAIGGPVRRRSDLVQVEARSFPITTIGLAPRATYEWNSAEWAVELPMYVRQRDTPFNGGVSVGWDSERDDVHVSLFVGAFPSLF